MIDSYYSSMTAKALTDTIGDIFTKFFLNADYGLYKYNIDMDDCRLREQGRLKEDLLLLCKKYDYIDVIFDKHIANITDKENNIKLSVIIYPEVPVFKILLIERLNRGFRIINPEGYKRAHIQISNMEYFLPSTYKAENKYEGYLPKDIENLKEVSLTEEMRNLTKGSFCEYDFNDRFFRVYEKKGGKYLASIDLFYPKPLIVENKNEKL